MNRYQLKMAGYQNRPALEILDEAIHLLKRSPASLHLIYLLGSGPFVLGFLFFFVDMSYHAYAARHCASYSLVMALLYLWMKFWQGLHALKLRDLLHQVSTPWNTRKLLTFAFHQAVIQPSIFLILPLAALLTIPFGWVYAFYHYCSCCGVETTPTVQEILKKAWTQTKLWPKQNHLILLIASGFGLIVFINVMMGLMLIPWLLKIFFDMETVFLKSNWAYLNMTFFCLTLGLTYLCMNPLIKSVYVLRCFYGESIHTGIDLLTDLKTFARKSTNVLFILILLGGSSHPFPCHGNEPSPSQPGLENSKLDESINVEIQKSEYAWRLPRAKEAKDDGMLASFKKAVGTFVKDTLKSLWKPVKRLIRWIFGLFPEPSNHSSEPGSPNGLAFVKPLMIVLGLMLAGILMFLVWKHFKNRRRTAPKVATAIQAVPDLNQENIQADQLPSDEWLELGNTLLNQGDLRLALRAFYLSILASLAKADRIRLAKYKSNMDYQKELERRAHTFPELLTAFRENRISFENAWYGMSEVDGSIFAHFLKNCETIRRPRDDSAPGRITPS